MQVDTLYLSLDDFRNLYFNGAAHMDADKQAALRLFMDTIVATEERYNRVVQQAQQQMGVGGELRPVKTHQVRIHLHFQVEPA